MEVGQVTTTANSSRSITSMDTSTSSAACTTTNAITNGSSPPGISLASLLGSSTVGPSSNCNSSSSGKEGEKPPKWQLDLLMEKLRQKSVQLKPLVDTSKNIRQALMERRCIIDQNDKGNLQKSLDSLQQSLRVNSLQSMVERLEMVARQLGLRFTPGGTGHEWFIHSDMFYLELLIDSNGMVEDVKIQHEGKTEQQSCPEIVESLKKTNFQDFTAHLEGLVSIYQLTADKKIKSKAYIALQCLEADLASISTTYSHINEADTVIMKCLLGLLQPRKGGHPVKLVYFISPYEFLDVTTKSMLSNDVNTVISNKLGSSATIHIQASSSHKLQMSTTVNLTRTPDGKTIPRYGVLNATNSTVLPACFVLNFGKPMPICIDLLKAIHATTEIESFDLTDTQPILNLVTHQLSDGALNCSEQGLFVALPDQVHCYFMTDTTCLEGVMVSSICFTLASQLPQVVAILRQQSAFNTLVGSCVRVGSKPELDHIVFEVSALSHQKLSVSFQHPLDDSLVTLEFDLRDVTHPHCHLHAVANVTDIIPTLEEHACKVVKRSMSIPITLRAVIRRWQSMKAKADPPNPDFSVAVGGNGLGNLDVTRINDRSCGAESADRKSNASHQNVMVPPGIMNFNNVAAGNATNKPPPPPPLSASSSYSISPVGNYASQSPQSPMDILSYMNPYLNQMNLAAGGPPFPNITQNMAIQMIASQMGQNPATPSQMLMGLLDQVGQTQKRRKRKNTTDNLPSPKVSPQSIRPSQSPSRPPHSPMRRQSDSSDGSGAAVDKSSAINMLMTELGMDQLPDSRWNIDITPVNTSSESIDDLDSFKKQMAIKKTTPKRSLSLDSHSSEDISSIQSLIEGQDFKPLVTPSLSITPVSTTSSSVTSLLASIRPGIEIIPLPHNNPVSIPTSLTVTPIMSSAKSNNNSNNNNEKQDKPKKPKDRTVPGKRKFDPSAGGSEGDGRPTKLPFLDNRGRISPNINFTKKPTSPNLLLNSPSKPSVPTSQGKPSVSTLKSVSSSSTPNSPKLGENSAVKQKIKKPNTKGLKSFMGMGNIPQLKALSPAAVAVPSSPVKQQGTGGDSNNQLIGGMEGSRMTTTDAKLMSQANQAAVTALQQAAATLVANAAQKPHAATNIAKKGGLAAVIDKLKSVHSSTEVPSIGGPPSSSSSSSSLDKKESSASSAAATTMSAKDYLKVSSAITNDVMQQKKALTANSTVPGQEYMVKGGQGLKLTINKAKLKDPTKSPKPGGLGLKSPLSGVIKKGIPGMKPLSHLSALSAKLAIVTKKSTPINKDLMKDLSSLKPGNTPSSKVKDGKPPRLESEDLTKKLFLPGSVKSLESGTFASAPIFDPNKFQIPKKSRGASNAYENNSNSNKTTSSSSSIEKDISSSSSTLTSKSGKSTPPPSLTSNFMDFSLAKEKASTSSTVPAASLVGASSSMEMDTTAPPELVSEICSTATSSDGSWRSEPPALIEVNSIAPSVPLFMEKSKSEDSAIMFTQPQAPQAVEQAKGLLASTSPPLGHGINRNNNSGTNEVSSMDFTSPESPDPVNLVVNSSSAPQTIPTNPVSSPGTPLNADGPNAVQAPSGMNVTPPPETATQQQQQSPARIPTPPQIMNLQTQPPPQIPPEDVDEDRLIIDDGHANSNYTSAVPILKEIETVPPNSATSVSSETVEKCVEEKSKSPEMPPPPAPVDLSSSSSNSSFASPQTVVFAPPASPKGVPSPLGGVGGGGATMSIASVHIVHSPQPNSPSPALLRSPLVQMSASPAASPYQIDDDLMDEALIGGSSK